MNKQYVWGSYVDECIQLRTYVTSGAGNLAAGTYYPLQDLLYRTKALTDTNEGIVEAYDYDPYGNTLIFSEAGTDDNWWADDAVQANYAVCEVLYAGYRYDAESKTYQVRNRQYNPVLGRWVQRDPIGFDGGDWNLYGYVNNSPIDNTDAFGLTPIETFWKCYCRYRRSGRNFCEIYKYCNKEAGGNIPMGYVTKRRANRHCGYSSTDVPNWWPKDVPPPKLPPECQKQSANCEDCQHHYYDECVRKKGVGGCRHIATGCETFCSASWDGWKIAACWKGSTKAIPK